MVLLKGTYNQHKRRSFSQTVRQSSSLVKNNPCGSVPNLGEFSLQEKGFTGFLRWPPGITGLLSKGGKWGKGCRELGETLDTGT